MFSEWVKKARANVGRTHEAVAAYSGGGISASYVGHIETQTVKPADMTLKKLIALANGLDLPASEVVNAALQDAGQGSSVLATVPSFKANINEREREESKGRVQERADSRTTGRRKKH